MSQVIARLKESELRSLDRWAVLSIAAMGLGPLLPFALGGF